MRRRIKSLETVRRHTSQENDCCLYPTSAIGSDHLIMAPDVLVYLVSITAVVGCRHGKPGAEAWELLFGQIWDDPVLELFRSAVQNRKRQ